MKIKTSLFLNIKIVWVTSILLFSCDPADNRLMIVNNSNKDIYYFFSCNSSSSDLIIFRNGYYKNSVGDSTYIQSNQYVKKGSIQNVPKKGLYAWRDFFKKCKNEKIHFYILTEPIVSKYSDSEIINHKMYDKHIICTIKELKQNNWTLTYP